MRGKNGKIIDLSDRCVSVFVPAFRAFRIRRRKADKAVTVWTNGTTEGEGGGEGDGVRRLHRLFLWRCLSGRRRPQDVEEGVGEDVGYAEREFSGGELRGISGERPLRVQLACGRPSTGQLPCWKEATRPDGEWERVRRGTSQEVVREDAGARREKGRQQGLGRWR